MEDNSFDVIVIGAGLAGLTAGISLQQARLKVLIIEKNLQPGGLCGTFFINNYEFVIGCNDFCEKVVKIFEELNVEVDFVPSRARFYFNHDYLDLPPTFSTWLKLLRHPLQLINLIRYLKKCNVHEETVASLANQVSSSTLANLIKSFALPYGMRPDELFLHQLKEEFSSQYQYNHQKPFAPKNGPAVMTQALVAKFLELNGTLKLNTACLEVQSAQKNKQVLTSNGIFNSKYLITSVGRYDQYPPDFKPGLAIAKFEVAVKYNFKFPENLHTIVFLPQDISAWFKQIDEGAWPEEVYFHIFPFHPQDKNYYSINIYTCLPRGLSSPSPEQIKLLQTKIFLKIEEKLFGFMQSILASYFISVDDFKKLHDLPSNISPIVSPHFVKPDNYDALNDIYYIGNTVYPPGNHAGAAMLSGLLVAKQILRESHK